MGELSSYLPSALIRSQDGKFGVTVCFKCDFQLPTGSFKYREALAVDVTMRKYSSLKRVIVPSSGNSARAIQYLADQSDGLYEAIPFIWDGDVSREEAHIRALREYLKHPATETVFLIGKDNPIKRRGHKILALELNSQLDFIGERLGSYFQVAGSGYGCNAVAQQFPDAKVYYCRPMDAHFESWAPAIVDAPVLSDKLNRVFAPTYLIREAYTYLNRLVTDPGDSVGLEAATALACFWLHYAEHGLPTDHGAVVINLTGRLRGKLPW